MATTNHPTGRQPAAGADTDQPGRPAELRSTNDGAATQNWVTGGALPAAGSCPALQKPAGSPPSFPSGRGAWQRRKSYRPVLPISQPSRFPRVATEDRAGVVRQVGELGGPPGRSCVVHATPRACAWTDPRAAAAVTAPRSHHQKDAESRRLTGHPNGVRIAIPRARLVRPRNLFYHPAVGEDR